MSALFRELPCKNLIKARQLRDLMSPTASNLKVIHVSYEDSRFGDKNEDWGKGHIKGATHVDMRDFHNEKQYPKLTNMLMSESDF